MEDQRAECREPYLAFLFQLILSLNRETLSAISKAPIPAIAALYKSPDLGIKIQICVAID